MKVHSLLSLATVFVICVSCQSQDEKKIIQQAQSEARQTIATAELRAKRIIETAENEAKRIIKEAEDKVERFYEEAENELDSLYQEYERLEMYLNSNQGHRSSASSPIYISFSDLYQIVREYDTNAAAADIKYRGTRIITDFNYFDISSYSESVHIVKSSGLLVDYTFEMNASQKEVAASLNKNQRIKIEGTLSHGSRYGLTFIESVILEVMKD